MSPPPFVKYLNICLGVFIILFVCHSSIKYIYYLFCTEEISVKDAEDWLVAEIKSNDSDEKFRCLKGALQMYSVTSVPTIYYNWRYIVSKMGALHRNNVSLKVVEDNIYRFCQERSMESLDLISECVNLDLISYNREGGCHEPLLGYLLKSIEVEQQGNNTAYVDKAVGIVINAINKGARFGSFSSRIQPMSESELLEKAIKIADCELFKLLIENEIISESVLRADKTKGSVFACGNRDIIELYCKWGNYRCGQ